MAYYGQPKERTNETLDCASEAKIWKVSYQPRWARDISVLCASLRMSGVQALHALSIEGSFRSRDIECTWAFPFMADSLSDSPSVPSQHDAPIQASRTVVATAEGQCHMNFGE